MDKWDPFDTSSVSVPPDSSAPRDPGWPGTTATLDWLSGPSQDPVPVLPVASTEPGPSIYPALSSVGGAAIATIRQTSLSIYLRLTIVGLKH